jgi:hypothetical protein
MNKSIPRSRKKRKQQRSGLPIILLAAGFILVLIFAIITLTNGNIPVTNQDTIPRVSISNAKDASDRGEALILDVRSASAFEASHVENAVNIPLDVLEASLGDLDRQQWIIPYCT